MLKKGFHSLSIIFVLLTVVLSSCAPALTPVLPTSTPTAIPKTPTPMVTATPTLDPNVTIYTLAYELRTQHGNFDVVETDEGVQRAIFENGKVFEFVDAKLVEIEIPLVTSEEPEITPIFTQEINKKYLGVQIHTKIITDDSFQLHSTPSIVKIIIDEDTVVQFIARTIFKAWWAKGNIEHKEKPTETDFKDFMNLWSAAQNNKGSWEDVQFETYANDLATPGYNQELVTIWPMFTGETQAPAGVRAVSEINLVYIIGEYSTNRTILDDVFGDGLGTNLDNSALDMYVIPISTISGLNANPVPRSNHNLVGITHYISWFLVNNPGKPKWTPSLKRDDQLYNLLLWGFSAYTSKGAQDW